VAFVLAGSSRFLTVPGPTEWLAGRGRIIDLWLLTQGEICGGADSFIDSAFAPIAELRATPEGFFSRLDVIIASP